MATNAENIILITDQFQLNEYSSESNIRMRKRNLPHWEMGGAVYFVTFRLANTIPQEVIDKF